MNITILGIESSCDDTSAAVLRDNTLLANVIASQSVHIKYGGVIPELAPRAHQQNIVPVVDTALKSRHRRGRNRRYRVHARARTGRVAAGGRVVRQRAR